MEKIVKYVFFLFLFLLNKSVSELSGLEVASKVVGKKKICEIFTNTF